MSTHPLLHLIYTNAPGSDGTGYRFVICSNADLSDRVKAWVESFDLDQLKNGQRGFATKCFKIANQQHVCLAVTLAGFARDTHGRPGGSLTHVLATPVNEGNDSGLHIVALMDKADALQYPQVEDAQRLAVYLEKYTQDSTITVAPPCITDLQTLGMETLKRLLIVAYATFSGHVIRTSIPLDEPARALAYGVGALPPRLRLAFSWSYKTLVPEQPNFISAAELNESFTLRHQEAEECFRWIWHALESGNSVLFEPLWQDWDIRSWENFGEYLSMHSKNTPESELFPSVLSPEIRTALQREYEAMRKMLRKEINEGIKSALEGNTQRLNTLELRLDRTVEDLKTISRFQKLDDVQPHPHSDGHGGLNIFGILQKYSVLIILGILVIIFIYINKDIWPPHWEGSTGPQTKVEPSAPQPVPSSVADSATETPHIVPNQPKQTDVDMFGKPSKASPKQVSSSATPAGEADAQLEKSLAELKTKFETYTKALEHVIKTPSAKEHSKLKALIKKVSTAEGLEGTSHSVSEGQKERFAKYAKGESRLNVYIIKMGLFEYIAAINCKASDCGNQEVTVSLSLGDITEDISSTLNQSLPQSARFEPLPPVNQNDNEFKEFMAAVVLVHLLKED
jgi:hypothetical protein